ncbi:hypothetical protein ACLOJK_007350 [Asimina triloba]
MPPGKQKLGTYLSFNVRREAPLTMRLQQDHSTLPMHHRLKIRKLQLPGDVSRISCLAGVDEIPSITDAGISSPLAATALTQNMAPNAHDLYTTSQPHPSSALRAPDRNSPLAFHLQMQPTPNGFQILKMAIFRPSSDPTGYVVNYNPHGPSNQRQRPVTAVQLICIRQGPNEPLRDYMARFNQKDRKVSCLLIEVYMSALIQGIRDHELTRELDLCPPHSIYELNEVIARYISTEKIERWRVEQGRLLIDHLDRRKALRVTTSALMQPKLVVLTPPAYGPLVKGDSAIRQPRRPIVKRILPLGDP